MSYQFQNYKPEGYNSLSPYFIVSDPAKWIDLLGKLFVVKELRKYENPDGSLLHAEYLVEDSVIMLSQGSEQYPANQFLVHVYVPDVMRCFKKAIDAGCQSVKEPQKNEGDPDQRGMFRDFAGNIWAVATQINESYHEPY